MTRGRLLLAVLAALGLALPLGAGAFDAVTDKFSATVVPAAVQPVSSHGYTIAILNRQISDDGAQSAQISVPAGFVVNPSTLTATTTTAGGCSGATWTATLGVGSIDLAAPDAASELEQGCTLNVVFSAVAPLAEGTYTWTTSVSRGTTTFDLQGTQPTVKVDGTAPPAPTLSNSPTDPSNDTSPTFSFSDTDESATFTCQLDGGGFSTCASPKTYNGPLGDGPHTFDVKAVDPAGNESGLTSYAWTIDTVDPTGSLNINDGDTYTSSTAVTLNLSATDANGIVSYRVANGSDCTSGTFVPPFSAVSPYSADPSFTLSAGDGAKTVCVQYKDAAGNISTAYTDSITLDQTNPTISVTHAVNGSNGWNTNDPVSVSVAVSDATSGIAGAPSCTVDGNPATVTGGSSPFHVSVTGEGSHSVSCSVSDKAGHSNSVSDTVRIDTVDPSGTLTINGNAPYTGSTAVTLNLSATDANGIVSYRVANGSDCTSGTFVPPFSAVSPYSADPSFTLSAGDGAKTVCVQYKDAAGNISTAYTDSITLDTLNPVAAIVSGPADPTNQTSATFSFSSSKSPSTYECQLDGVPFVACSNPQTYLSLPEGTHSLVVRAKDLLHTGPSSSPYTWTIDLRPPAAPSIAGGPPAATNQTSARFVFSDEPGAAFECRLDGAAFSVCTSPAAYSGLADGGHEFAVRATDPAGNTGPPATYGWTVDTIAPDTTITKTPDAVSSSASATFEFTSSKPLSSFSCSHDGSPFASCSSPQTYGGLADGSHTFQVRASDLAGNTDPTPASYSWQVATLLPPDTTPPGAVRRLKRSVAYRLLKLTWRLPADADFDHVRVLMSRSAKRIPRTVVYQGRAASYANKRFQNGAYYRYAVISYDHFGNASRRATVVVPPSVLLRSPGDGAVVKSPPRLLWAAVPKATYYNVQLYTVKGKVLSAWPGSAKLKLSRSWRYAGRRFELKKGLYRWFVWPGFGPRARGRYGQLLGQGTFRVS